MKNNYKLNININNNKINVNHNNNINNNTYSINNLTDRNITKNKNIKNIVNLKQNRNNINKTVKMGCSGKNSQQSKMEKSINNSIKINKKKGKNIIKRNYEKSINDAMIFITDNNLANSYLFNNNLENNDKMNKTTKKHVISVSSLVDSMNNNKFISLDKNLNKNK